MSAASFSARKSSMRGLYARVAAVRLLNPVTARGVKLAVLATSVRVPTMPHCHHPYVRGFVSTAHRILPLACVAAFLGIVWLEFGAGLNVPALVWHDEPMLQASAGFSIAALF